MAKDFAAQFRVQPGKRAHLQRRDPGDTRCFPDRAKAEAQSAEDGKEIDKLQDRLFAELARVVAPGGVVVLSDSVASDDLRSFHDGDIYNPVDPEALPARLERAGFTAIDVQANFYGFVAHARVP